MKKDGYTSVYVPKIEEERRSSKIATLLTTKPKKLYYLVRYCKLDYYPRAWEVSVHYTDLSGQECYIAEMISENEYPDHVGWRMRDVVHKILEDKQMLEKAWKRVYE